MGGSWRGEAVLVPHLAGRGGTAYGNRGNPTEQRAALAPSGVGAEPPCRGLHPSAPVRRRGLLRRQPPLVSGPTAPDALLLWPVFLTGVSGGWLALAALVAALVGGFRR